jgi:hypothetical protein
LVLLRSVVGDNVRFVRRFSDDNNDIMMIPLLLLRVGGRAISR